MWCTSWMILRNESPSKWIRGYGIGWNAITLIKEVVFLLKCDQYNKRLYRLTKFLGQGLGSAQPILDDSLKETYTQIKVSHGSSIIWVSPVWDMLQLSSYSTLGLRMISSYHTRFHTNLIIFISQHNHVLDMIILFPSSTSSIKDLFLVVPTFWD
jgi:hypothetical protein